MIASPLRFLLLSLAIVGVLPCQGSSPLAEVRALNSQRQFEKALVAARALVAAAPSSPEAHAELGRALRGVRELGPATESLLLSHQMQPQEMGVLYDLAGTLDAQARYEEALIYWTELDSLAASLPGVSAERLAGIAYARAEAARKLDRISDATAAYRRAVTTTPNNPEYRVRFGEFLINEGRWEEARPVFESLVRQIPNNPTYQYGLGLCHLELKNDEAAEKHLKKARELDRSDYRTCLSLGKLYLRRTDPDEKKQVENLKRAHAYYAAAAEINPLGHEAAFGKGRAARLLGWKEEAKQHEARYRELKEKTQEFEEALRTLRRNAKTNPRETKPLFEIAQIYLQGKRWADALETYSKLLSIDPNHEIAILNSCQILRQLNRPQEAYFEVEKILRREPGNPFANLESARILLGLRQVQPALTRLKIATDSGGLDPARQKDALQMLAAVHKALGNQSEAARYQELAAAIDATAPGGNR